MNMGHRLGLSQSRKSRFKSNHPYITCVASKLMEHSMVSNSMTYFDTVLSKSFSLKSIGRSRLTALLK